MRSNWLLKKDVEDEQKTTGLRNIRGKDDLLLSVQNSLS
jgi:hypothetical protein